MMPMSTIKKRRKRFLLERISEDKALEAERESRLAADAKRKREARRRKKEGQEA